MKTLEKILGNQKQRGILGEIQLENLLSNVLPPELFQMEYSFNNNEAVDAIIKVGEFIIPIDAKFSQGFSSDLQRLKPAHLYP